MKIAFLLIFSLAWIAMAAQSDEKLDRMYDDQAYAKYIEACKNKKPSDLTIETRVKLADSYRKTGDSRNAEYLYAMILDERDEPQYHFMYAQSLHNNGKYKDAKKHYLIYHDYMKQFEGQDSYDGRGKKLARACDQVAQYKAVGDVFVKNLEKLNSPQNDFSPCYYKEGLAFASMRTSQNAMGMDVWTNERFTDLYFSERQGDTAFSEPKPFSNKINSKFHEGPLTFLEGGKKMYFTRNNFLKGKKGKSDDDVIKLKIYSAEFKAGKWGNIEAISFNEEETDACHPTVSSDGSVLVFASNREGGFGGMDLYVSFKNGESWTAPQNLGPEVNTQGNDVFPFLGDDGNLYFASNGHEGLGGLDVYIAERESDKPDALWTSVMNIGSPFNSHYDDFGFILNKEKTEGFFTSSRIGGQGQDDVYWFSTEDFDAVRPKQLLSINVCVYNRDNGKRIEDAEVYIRKINPNAVSKVDSQNMVGTMENGAFVVNLAPGDDGQDKFKINLNELNLAKKELSEVHHTDLDGAFEYFMQANEEYIFEVSKSGYFVTREAYILSKEDDIEELCISVRRREYMLAFGGPDAPINNTPGYDPDDPDAPMVRVIPPELQNEGPLVTGMAFDKEDNKPVDGASITLVNRCTGEEIAVEIGEQGMFWLPLKCGCEFVLKATKDGYTGSSQIIAMDSTNCDQDNTPPIIVDLAMRHGFDRINRPFNLGGNTLNETIKEGDLIELKNIYYDFNEHFIRDDARSDLDELVTLMNAFPSMEIELSSHTDSRGKLSYNDGLSSRRAKAAREYLIQRGIASSRISAVGYGERRPLNNCRDGMDCSEFEHQRNRRTEVFVRRFDQSEYVQVHYQNNAPKKVDPKPGEANR